MLFTYKSFPAQLVKRTFDGCAGKVSLRSNGAHSKPAAALCIGVVLQTAVDNYRTMSQTGIMNRIEIAYKSSPDLSRKSGLRGIEARQKILCKRRQAVVKETGANQRISLAGHNPA
jgi:hypothetical protein